MKKTLLSCFMFHVSCFMLLGCASTPPPPSTSSVSRMVKYQPAVKTTPSETTAPWPSGKSAGQTLSPFPGKDETLNPFPAEPVARRKPMFMPRFPPMQEVGFLYRPPRGFEHQNPRSHTFVNDTKYAARIFVDGTELRQVTNGTVAQTPVVWNGGTRFLPLLPPDAKLYNIGDSDEHTIMVELYAGPAPLQYAMTCKIEINFLKQQIVYLSYRACHKSNASL